VQIQILQTGLQTGWEINRSTETHKITKTSIMITCGHTEFRTRYLDYTNQAP